VSSELLTFEDAAGILKSGGVLLMGTDTLPGFHCRADLPEAVVRIIALKGRPAEKSLLLVAGSMDQVALVAGTLDSRQEAFCRCCWPGPFSLILPAGGNLAPEVPGPDATVAVRVPDLPSLCDLVLVVGFPLVSTSANHSGEPPLESLEAAHHAFGKQIDGVWQPIEKETDMQENVGAGPSALIDLTVWPFRQLRSGPRNPPALGGGSLDGGSRGV
jgi:L-threonylcarbamoyladenylate synthase